MQANLKIVSQIQNVFENILCQQHKKILSIRSKKDSKLCDIRHLKNIFIKVNNIDYPQFNLLHNIIICMVDRSNTEVCYVKLIGMIHIQAYNIVAILGFVKLRNLINFPTVSVCRRQEFKHEILSATFLYLRICLQKHS